MSQPIRIDARGHRCPVPSLRLRRAMAGHVPGAVFELLATDPMARIDVPYLMQEAGGEVLSLTEVDGVLTITVRSGVGPAV
ncbi:MAG: sulfurtransferase TusA family protein [Brevundimonas sp.]|uniref:sulfurtransferase TusA family protein n=1 Tax=Brevundimonas sp. TaxID=1871086 RepID=UPI001226A34E|nr:sulfurtransferase TusA family protein [Brevundimonas sp.]RZJ19282.1 MAG: sulfurtransferase TusA family protein [Brevundimonas sp.]